MRFIFAYVESEEAMEACIHIQGLRNLGFHSSAASNELPDLGQVTTLFKVLGSMFLCHTDEQLNLKSVMDTENFKSPCADKKLLIKVSVKYYGNLMSIPEHTFSGERDDHY